MNFGIRTWADPGRNLTWAQPKAYGLDYIGVALSVWLYKYDLLISSNSKRLKMELVFIKSGSASQENHCSSSIEKQNQLGKITIQKQQLGLADQA